MKKLFLLIPALVIAMMTNAAIPELTKSAPLTLTAASEGFSQSENAKALEDGEWINWSGGTIQNGFAKWRVNIVDPGVYSVTLDMKSTNTYEFRVCALNPVTNDTIAKCFTEHQDRGDYSNTELPCLQKLSLFAKEAGEYDIIVTDMVQWSSGKVRGMTISYVNGALTTASASATTTLIPNNAALSARAWVDKSGAVDSILYTPRGSEGHNLDEWVKWAVEISEDGYYDFTANTYRASSQKFEIALLNQNESEILISNDNGGQSIGSGNKSISTGKINLEKGIYVLRVRNIYQYAESRLLNAVVTYKGGKAVDVPGTLSFDDVILSDEAWIDKSGAVDSLLFTARGSEGHNSVNFAKWKVNVATAGAYNFKANVYRPDGSQRYEIKVLSNDENTELASNSLTGMPTGLASINSGNVYLEQGTYTVKVRNTYDYAKSRLLSVQAEYIGGAVQAMPGTTAINEAWFSAEGTRADGKIDFPDGTIQDGWVKWNVSFASGATFKVNLTINSNNSKNYTVALQDANGDDVVAPLNKNGGDKGTPVTLEMGEMTVPAGNYILKVTNATQWSDAELISVAFVYEGGAVVNIPAEELVGTEAVLVDAGKLKVSKLANGDLKYGDNGTPLGEYVYWNIHATKSGRMNVTANVVAPSEGDPSGHNFLVELFADLNEAALATTAEPSQTDATGARALPAIDIPAAGDYIVKLTNQTQWSSAILHSLEFEYVGGDRATLPATFDFADGLLSAKAHVTAGELWFNTIGDSDPVGQYANWNVKVDAAGTFLFTMNVSSTNSQSYKISFLDGETVVDAFESGSLGSGDKTVKHYFNLAAGNYTVKLENTYSWSQGHVVSLAVTQPELLVLDEAAEDNSVIVANYRNGNHDIQVIRSIVPNMYNTICLPFDVNSSQLQASFGSDVVLKQMSAATMNGNELTLSFTDALEGGINRGTPYLIKTTKAIVNPVFTAVEIKAKVGDVTAGDAADFIGNFIKSEVPAGDQNLFLMQDNELFFRQTATPIKGMRAYFHVNVPGAAQAIQRIRIEEAPAITTGINRVDANGSVKTIENGQLVIIKNGVKYNVMGIKLQ